MSKCVPKSRVHNQPLYKISYVMNLEKESIPEEHQIWRLNDGRLPRAQWITSCRLHVSLKMKRWVDKRTTKSLLKVKSVRDRHILQSLLFYQSLELPAQTMPPPPSPEIHPRQGCLNTDSKRSEFFCPALRSLRQTTQWDFGVRSPLGPVPGFATDLLDPLGKS